MENLEFNPMLKHLLKSYVITRYEEASNGYTDEMLWEEYQQLKESNMLDDLFYQEYLDNSWPLWAKS